MELQTFIDKLCAAGWTSPMDAQHTRIRAVWEELTRQPRIERLELALSLALNILGAQEPPDSRAVSDEFVAMAAVLTGNENASALTIINAAMKIPRESFRPKVEIVQPNTVPGVELLEPWFTEERFNAAKAEFEAQDTDCPAEILVMIAVLSGLIQSAEDHATDLDADGHHLSATEARQRRDGYDLSQKGLYDAWN